MVKTKKAVLKFKKTNIWINSNQFEEVADFVIIEEIQKLQEQFNFEILDIRIHSSLCMSYIKIKCKKEDKIKIMSNFYISLKDQVREVSIK